MFFLPPLDRLSSTWRLTILQAITIATSLALCLTLAVWVLRSDLEMNSRGEVLDDLGEHAAVYRQSGIPGVDAVFAAGHHATDEGMRILAPDGKLLAEHLPNADVPFAWPDSSKLSRLAPVIGTINVEHPTDDAHLMVGRAVLSDGAVLWHARMDIADAEAIRDIRRYLWLAGLAAGLIALISVFWYAAQVMQPVQRMIESAEILARGHGQERLVAASAVPELRDFADAFNTVLERNNDLTSELQAANDHLAHELRTPLSRIRGNLESFSQHVTEPLAREAAERGLEEIDRASELVSSILTVRAGDHGALKLHCEEVDLRELLSSILDLYQPSAEDRGLELSLTPGKDVTLSLDRQRMVQAITNLLDNALSYTPSKGKVTVQLTLHDGSVRMAVQDTGPGLQPGELETVWQRFVRGSVASAKAPGMGLGLSLVRAIVHAHGGSCGCGNREGGGAEFWISLPVKA